MGGYNKGINNPSYKDGRSLNLKLCIFFHNQISYRSKTGLCRSCYLKTLKGKGNPNYGKRSRKIWVCQDCGKEVTWNFTKCHSCAGKDIWQTSEAMKNRDFSGENNPNYINGQSNFPYPMEFNESLKLQIRERDCFTCQNCQMTEEEHLRVYGQSLHVHHIDYDKENLNQDNLITLCNSCNTRANYNRHKWMDKYNKIMEELYRGNL